LNRIGRMRRAVGLFEALRFEVAWSLRPEMVRVRVPGHAASFMLRRWSSDLAVFETVFVAKELEPQRALEPRMIIDGGANIGLSTAFYARRFPHARVIAVEPSEENLALLRVNCAGLDNVEVVSGGLWSGPGYLRIANPEDAAWALRCEPAHAGSIGAFPAYSIDEILDRAPVAHCDLLKLDIEGAEEQVFAAADSWLSRVGAILVEIHGPRARSAVEKACPATRWERHDCGEKLLLIARHGGGLLH